MIFKLHDVLCMVTIIQLLLFSAVLKKEDRDEQKRFF